MPKHMALVSSVWLTFMLVSCGGGDLPKNVKEDMLKHIEAENTLISSGVEITVSGIDIVESARATPPKEFIDKYNPKKTYCVSCRYETETLERGKPPEKYSQYDDFLVLITQTGETAIIAQRPMSTSILSTNKTSPKPPKVSYEERPTWNKLWERSCPYKPLELKRQKKWKM